MDALDKLRELDKLYKHYRNSLNGEKAANLAVKEAFKDTNFPPFIYSDECNEPHYIAVEDLVYVFGYGIYVKI